MRHRIASRHLSRTTSHRIALRRNMAASLIQHGTIRTTMEKAKELRRFVERLITVARKGTLTARRRVISMLNDRLMADKEENILDKTVVQKLMDEVAPKYASRPGGYTRIIRLADRRIGDAGSQVLLQLVEETSAKGGEEGSRRSRRSRRAAKRQEAAQAAEQAQPAEQAPSAAAEAQTEQPADQEGKE